MFPRSSRRRMEESIISFFEKLHLFLESGREYAKSMQVEAESLHMGQLLSSETVDCMGTLKSMLESRKNELKSTLSTLKAELESALLEPYFGFANRLDPQSLTGLLSEVEACMVQVEALMKGLKEIENRHADEESLIVEEIDWTRGYARSLNLVWSQMDVCCETLAKAFPDGRFRPQRNTCALGATTAAASFRDFADVRLQVISIWTSNFQQLQDLHSSSSTPVDIYALDDLLMVGITTSHILELLRHLQLAGKQLERYARTFPTHLKVKTS